MATQNVNRIIRASGRVIINPTNLSAAYPYGGREIGKTKTVVLAIQGTPYKLKNEALGELTNILEADKRFVFSCVLRGWDNDALQLLWADMYTAGSVTGHAVYSEPASAMPGTSTLDVARKILFAPDDPINVPALLIYRGVPSWGDSAQLAWSGEEDLALPFAADCLRDSSNRILKMGRLADLTL